MSDESNGAGMKVRRRVVAGPRVDPGQCAEPEAAAPAASEADDLSRRLSDELEKQRRYEFGSVHRRGKERALRPDLERIVEHVFVDKLDERWQRIKRSLRVGDQRSEHGALHKALDDARQYSYEAHRLYVTARLERESWEAENEVVFGAMWLAATQALQHEKDTKERSKAITEQDVRAKAAVLFPAEWPALEKRRLAVKLAVENMSQLCKDASDHCEDLRTMLGKLRG